VKGAIFRRSAGRVKRVFAVTLAAPHRWASGGPLAIARQVERRPRGRSKDSAMIGGASLRELGFAALLFFMVMLAPVAPRIGEAVGRLFEKRRAPPRGTKG